MQPPVLDAMIAVALALGVFVICMLLVGYTLIRIHKVLSAPVELIPVEDETI